MIPLKVEAQIREKIKAERAPLCAHCKAGDSLYKRGKAVHCSKCGGEFKDLKTAWRAAYNLAANIRRNSLANIK